MFTPDKPTSYFYPCDPVSYLLEYGMNLSSFPLTTLHIFEVIGETFSSLFRKS